MEKALSSALERATEGSEEFRAGLPVNFLGYMGSWHDREVGEGGGQRAAFARRFKELLRRLDEYVDLDEVCDELGVDFAAKRLPAAPELAGAGKPADQVTPDTLVRWVDPGHVRAMLGTDPETSEATVMLFHTFDNVPEQHMCQGGEPEEEVGCLRFEAAFFMPALRVLLA